MALTLYGTTVRSRLLLGTARYPSPLDLSAAVRQSGTEIVTVSLRRETAGSRTGGTFFELIRELGVHVLPNTAGCHTVSEAVLTAKMARDLFRTNWIKLELIGHQDTLQPDVFQLVEAARLLSDDGFEVFPYTTDDLVVGERLLRAGCQVLMPWCAPIGSAMGPQNILALRSMRAEFPEVPLIVDAGMGRPSHATTVMELGYDAVLLNTAVSGAGDTATMARAFALAIEAGKLGHDAGLLEPRDMAVPSTPLIGKGVFA
ncbi:thiazole synthase [Rhizobium lemnae]|uniref:Thiazole synthase n=1 Tax=Rhizobium lemnae TaxID=1214924 RepID=A0ABV8E5R5_9HYPH|nr:thiazole synthase [Rhizobium lemnae]MCJ8506584.1 thiazole synthase [Rhizobium lemnae]